MIDLDELKAFIEEVIEDHGDNEEQWESIRSQLKRKIEEANQGYNSLALQMADINRQVKANNVGVNNVYEQFKKITDSSFIRDWTAEKKMIEKKLDDMQKTIDETFNFVNSCKKKMAVINDLYSLRNVDTVMITKIAHLVKAMQE